MESGCSSCNIVYLTPFYAISQSDSIFWILKTLKKKPRGLEYRNYKHFNSVLFNEDFKYMFSHHPVSSYDKFDKMFLEVLDKHAARKKKILRANHSSFESNTPQLRKKLYFRNRTENSLNTFKWQKNYCSRLYKKERKEFFNNLNPSYVKDNKIFWKTIKSFFRIIIINLALF